MISNYVITAKNIVFRSPFETAVKKKGQSYIKDTDDFVDQIKNINAIPWNVTLVAADVSGLYPSILHQASLEALKETLDKTKLVKMTEFVLKTNYFQYMNRVYY